MAPRCLWLLRHAKAVADPPDGGADFDRVLAPRGRRDATALGRLIGHDAGGLGLGAISMPEVTLVSPAARTRATAVLALADVPHAPELELVPDLYGAEPEEVLDLVRALPDTVTAAMVVGHNPTAHALALDLIAKNDKGGRTTVVHKGFPTCALGIYEFDLPHWRGVGSHTARLAGLFTPPFGAE
jgi:phosphohistidine phosphatase